MARGATLVSVSIGPYPAPPRTRPEALRLLPPLELVPGWNAPPLPLEAEVIAEPPPPVPDRVVRAARALARALTEVLQGRRPLQQVESILLPRVASATAWLALDSSAGPGLRLRSVRTQAPADGVAEVTLVWADGRRVHAAALRMELRQGVWTCVELEASLAERIVRTASAA